MLTEADALRAYARMMNTLDARGLEPLLADDFHYTSQWVFEEIESKQAYLDYIRPKLETIARTKTAVFAELGTASGYRSGNKPCVVMAQNDREHLVALVFGEVADGKLKRLSLCAVPPPEEARRSGEYPT